MGKSSSTSSSSSSCFKLIPCGTSNTGASSDNDNDDFNHPTTTQTTKASSDKRGWSFRKKSGRHRVLGSNVTSESSTFADKEVSLPLVVKTEFQEPVKSTSANEKPPLAEPAEKDSALEYDGVSKKSPEVIASENYSGKPKLGQVMVASDNDSNSTSTEVDDTVLLENGSFEPTIELTIDTKSVDLKSENNELDKPETIELEKPEALNSVVASEDVSNVSVMVDEPVAIVLQSSIRGFMAQQEYLQLKNVVMLQAVIRGHLVRRNAVESLHCIRSIAKVQALVRAHSGKASDQNNKKSEGQFSTENLLKNSFTRQLLESTPKPKSVNIRCDPLSPNSAWIWLERWMSMSVSSEVSPKLEPSSTDLQNDNRVQSYDPQNEDEKLKSSMSLTDSLVSKAVVDETPKSSESEESHCFNIVDPVEMKSSQPIFTENYQSHNPSTEEINEDMHSSKMDNFVSQEELVSNSDEVTADIPHPKLSAKRVASEELTDEGKKLSSESRKDSYPAETVTHSDFEGLSSAAESGKSINSSDTKVEADTSSTLVEIETPSKPSEPSVLGVDPQNLFAVSECGTELSVTSALDSPDRSELEIPQPEPQVQIFGIDESKQGEDCEIDGKINQEEVQETTGVNVSVSPAVSEVIPQMEQKIEMKASDEPKNFTGTDENSAEIKPKEDLNDQHQEEKLSPQASPRSSHITVAESQGTPSSQVSVNKDKRNKSGKSGSIPKPSSRSAGKKSPSTPNLKSPSTPIMDSGDGRNSVEHLPKDHKSSGKRRNSFGSTKSDTPDQESRDSNSNTSLPSYMQATKSAKAKVHSPKSSPDFHDKEITPKKRQSFPGAGGRQQVSPRVQGSTSDAPQGGGGAKPTSSERKWQR